MGLLPFPTLALEDEVAEVEALDAEADDDLELAELAEEGELEAEAAVCVIVLETTVIVNLKIEGNTSCGLCLSGDKTCDPEQQ